MLNTQLSERTLKAFSLKTEIKKTFEELDELKAELEKFRYVGKCDSFGECRSLYGNLILEMADVEIVLSHLWTALGNYGVFMGAIQEKSEKLKKQLVEAEKKTKKKGK